MAGDSRRDIDTCMGELACDRDRRGPGLDWPYTAFIVAAAQVSNGNCFYMAVPMGSLQLVAAQKSAAAHQVQTRESKRDPGATHP